MIKTYIVVPNFSIPLDTLQLGDILADPLDAELAPLNRRSRQDVPAELLSTVVIAKNFSSPRERLLSARFGLWAKFLACLGLPVGTGTGLRFEKHSKDVISADELHTHELDATDEYVAEMMAPPAVESYVDGCGGKPLPVYMVTGIKVAKGLRVNVSDSSDFNAELSLTAPDAVAETKPIVQLLRKRADGMAFKSKTDVILAFRVRKVSIVDGELSHKLSLKGTTMLDGDAKAREESSAGCVLGDELSSEEAKTMGEEDGISVAVVVDKQDAGTSQGDGDLIELGPDEAEVQWVIGS